MATQTKLKGGRKLRRCHKDAPYYAQQFFRTQTNKIRRLRKRLAFDTTAAASIIRLGGRV